MQDQPRMLSKQLDKYFGFTILLSNVTSSLLSLLFLLSCLPVTIWSTKRIQALVLFRLLPAFPHLFLSPFLPWKSIIHPDYSMQVTF